MSAPDLVVFDLDGTLTRRDTLVPFLARVAGRARTAVALALVAPELLRATRDRSRRDASKSAVLHRTLRGRPLADVAETGSAYAAHVCAHQLRQDTAARLRWHQSQGHHCVIASASPAVYVRPLAELLRVDDVVATELEVDADGLLTGSFAGANCRGQEKLRRLEGRFGVRPIVWAYGDSVDDQLVLDRAVHPLLVGKAHVGPAT